MTQSKKCGFLLLLIILLGIGLLFVFLLIFRPAIGKAADEPIQEITSLPRITPPLTQPVACVTTFPTITPHTLPQASPTPPTLYAAQQLTPPNNRETEIESLFSAQQDPSESITEASIENPFVIGYSINGLPLDMYRFGDGSSLRLIIAGIHGGYEYNTTALAYELIAYITDSPDVIPSHITLYILPVLNPDGLATSHGYEGRANMNNVDLNRNWDHNWSAEWDPNGCWQFLPITGGTEPFSEPETTALNNFILLHDFDAVISYHSAGLGIFAGGSPEVTVSEPLAKAIASVAPYPYPPVFTVCEFTGQFTDYLAIQNIPAIDIELTNHKDTDFELNIPVLHAFLNWQRIEP